MQTKKYKNNKQVKTLLKVYAIKQLFTVLINESHQFLKNNKVILFISFR